MTLEEKKKAFRSISYAFSVKSPVLPNDFREWGITSYSEAQGFLQEFIESEMKDGVRWIIEEKPYKCRVKNPVTGEVQDGDVTAFYGQLDFGWRHRSAK